MDVRPHWRKVAVLVLTITPLFGIVSASAATFPGSAPNSPLCKGIRSDDLRIAKRSAQMQGNTSAQIQGATKSDTWSATRAFLLAYFDSQIDTAQRILVSRGHVPSQVRVAAHAVLKSGDNAKRFLMRAKSASQFYSRASGSSSKLVANDVALLNYSFSQCGGASAPLQITPPVNVEARMK